MLLLELAGGLGWVIAGQELQSKGMNGGGLGQGKGSELSLKMRLRRGDCVPRPRGGDAGEDGDDDPDTGGGWRGDSAGHTACGFGLIKGEEGGWIVEKEEKIRFRVCNGV